MKKLFKVFSIVFLLLLVSNLSRAVNTITYDAAAGIIEITDIDSDWLYSDSLTWASSRINIISIQFNPAATDDECIILEADANGAPIFETLSIDIYDQKIKYYPQPNFGYKPFLDFDIGTYSAGSKIIIMLGK